MRIPYLELNSRGKGVCKLDEGRARERRREG